MSRLVLFAVLVCVFLGTRAAAADWQPFSIAPVADGVRPGCGLVLWDDHELVDTEAIQLEYSYLPYNAVATAAAPEQWHWAAIEDKLSATAARHHQLILRPYLVYPGQPAAVPAFVAASPGYQQRPGVSEKLPTGFPDWSNPVLQQFMLDFQREFSKRYDQDPRLAYVQVGFGLWSEYHIYDGPFKKGETFPDDTYQGQFLQEMAKCWIHTPWMISIDAADAEIAPVTQDPVLLALPFGCFDDSFLCKQHAQENAPNWLAMGAERWRKAPAGGEFSYYNKRDQKLALAEMGPHDERFEHAAQRFHLSFIIGSDQPQHAGMERVRAAGAALGYRFEIRRAEANGQSTRVVIANTGIAPAYQDIWPALGSVRSPVSLRELQPGEERTCDIPTVADPSSFQLSADRLVPGQRIGFTVFTDP